MKSIYLYITIIALSAIALIAIRSCHNQQQIVSTVKAAKNDTATYYRDKYQQEHAQVAILNDSYESARLRFGDEIDSMAALLKVKPNKITEIRYIGLETSVNVDSLCAAIKADTVLKYNLDTIQVPHYLNLSTTLSLTKYKKRSGFFRNTYMLDIHADNPAFHITNTKGFEINEKVKHWHVGPYIGYGIQGSKLGISAGISLSYSIISF